MKSIWVIGSLILIAVGGVCCAALEQQFSDPTLGYAIGFPVDWSMSRPSTYTVQFSGAPGTPAWRTTFTIQNVASTAIGGAFGNVDALVDDLRCQLVTGAVDVCLYGRDPLEVQDAAGHVLPGLQFFSEYAYEGDTYEEWIAVVPHASGSIFYVLNYTAPAGDYDVQKAAVFAMLESWTIGEASTDTGGETPPSTSAASGPISVLLETRDRVGPYDYEADAYDKRFYEVVVVEDGYLAIAVIDEPGEFISGFVYDAAAELVVQKPGYFASIYTTGYPVSPGTYSIKVGQDTMVTVSDFVLRVFFSTQEFDVSDLEAAFGPRNQTL